ncbi:HNH endonuclease [Acidovorax sp. sic0104]|uniref:HNH endonuclease n=1 Tax=Acidovorax sp. sic0104 TaxID=2854784 RepID=UPI001C4549EA|nr:HNH endonuclease [Acidovorax sp. sic0104]MBV7542254.1 HNH endonuclease [Acidovorax sp. sic0104]
MPRTITTPTETSSRKPRTPAPRVLQLDLHGTPQSWMPLEQAAVHYASGAVAWDAGLAPLATLRGGHNAATGRQSVLDVAPIIALRGVARINLFDVVPGLTKRRLLRRDRHTCAYCGGVFSEEILQCEHIVPQSRGGATSWTNLVAACAACNGYKAARLPEEAGMRLLFLPYVPSRYESFLLDGRNVRADVHEWLARRLPKGSRLH